jgi:hypothetical protein
MNRVSHLRRCLRSIRCSLKQSKGKWLLIVWPKGAVVKRKILAAVNSFAEAENLFVNLTLKD